MGIAPLSITAFWESNLKRHANPEKVNMVF